jgi:GMP synthase-like glutamine amidotransferase
VKTLLIDNGSTLTKKLGELSPGEETIVTYDEIPKDISDFSLILLSGSSQFPVYGNEEKFTEEIQLIKSSIIPIVGICLGHELIAHAFESTLNHLAEQHVGMSEVTVINQHPMFSGRETFEVYENHQYGVTEIGEELIVLAKTDHAIATFKHKEKHIYGFQFHPEHHTDEQFGDEVFLKLFQELVLG